MAFRSLPFAFASLVAAGTLALACSSDPDRAEGAGDPTTEDANLDYRATNGKEFDVATDVRVTLAAEDAALTPDEKKARASELARAKVDAITRALDAELLRIWPESRRQDEKNIVAMIRMATPAGDALREDGDGFVFTYHAEVAGPNQLLELLPLDRAGDLRTSKLTVGSDELTLTWTALPVTADSYPRYAEMFEDGLDIAIHVGGDHYDPRNDLREARSIYEELEKLGLRAPVPSFEELKLDSGAFRGAMTVAGREVPVSATLVHADMAPDDRLSDLVDSFKRVASTADVVIYRGHAGTSLDYSGVVVHYNPRVAIPASQFKDLDLPQKYQLFVFDGCETYTGYADKLYEHPGKDEKNADVITSVNYGSGLVRAESVRSLLHGLMDKTGDRWVPRSWDVVLKKLNDAQVGPWTSIYGVHGLSDNPRLSMLTDPAKTGTTCRSHADCGGADSLCVPTASGKVCGAACTDDTACAQGATCQAVQSRSLGTIRQCLPPR